MRHAADYLALILDANARIFHNPERTDQLVVWQLGQHSADSGFDHRMSLSCES